MRPSALLVLALACAGALLQACSDSEPSGTSSGGGSGGSGGAENPCDIFGPKNLESCSQPGVSCYYADTGCSMSWTCEGGEWNSESQCYPGTGGGGGAGGKGGAGGAGGAAGGGGT